MVGVLEDAAARLLELMTPGLQAVAAHNDLIALTLFWEETLASGRRLSFPITLRLTRKESVHTLFHTLSSAGITAVQEAPSSWEQQSLGSEYCRRNTPKLGAATRHFTCLAARL